MVKPASDCIEISRWKNHKAGPFQMQHDQRDAEPFHLLATLRLDLRARFELGKARSVSKRPCFQQ